MAEDAIQSEANVTRPIPPRYWWLKRIGCAVGVYVVLLIGLRIWFGYEAARRLQAKIDFYRAAGEPILPEDIVIADVPDSENTAYALRQAATMLIPTLTSPTNPNAPRATTGIAVDQLAGDMVAVREHVADLTPLIEANGPVLQLIREAVAKPRTDWGVRFTSPMSANPVPLLGDQRALSKLLSTTALYFHAIGDDDAAIEAIDNALLVSEKLHSHGTLIAHLVVMAIDQLCFGGIEAIAPELTVSAGVNDPARIAGPARRERVEALISRLVDEGTFRQAFRSAGNLERMGQLDEVIALDHGGTGLPSGATVPSALEGLTRIVLRPFWNLDACRSLDMAADFIAAGQMSNWPDAQKKLPPDPQPLGTIEGLINISVWARVALNQSVVLHFRALTSRRMAATALALRLYEIDHGHRPITLSELVPDYVPVLPQDPFAADGRPLGYRLSGEHPILYSVSTDGVDDGGSYGERLAGISAWRDLDYPFFLDGQRPRQPPLTTSKPTTHSQTAEQQDEVQDAEGQHDEDQ